jgi:hypothetical protein
MDHDVRTLLTSCPEFPFTIFYYNSASLSQH